MNDLSRPPWWRARREQLLAILDGRDCAYIYDLATVRSQAQRLLGMRSIARVFYAMKANPHPDILRTVRAAGCGFECVSRPEVEKVFEVFPDARPDEILFTPNFAPRDEYRWALAQGIRVTVDNVSILRDWSALFAGREIFLRLDAAGGRGHHEKVRTGGRHSKFGVPPEEFAELPQAVTAAGARVVGLHAHGGSGHFDPDGWLGPARVLAAEAMRYPVARVLNLGGGFGVPEGTDQAPMDLSALDDALSVFRDGAPQFDLWLEPGRLIVAQAGVLLARVTQVKGKADAVYVGVATGMNSLIRPALYGAHHDIVNLSRIGEAATIRCTVVGPICESGDELGRDRLLPRCAEGDVLLIADTGAYGHAMSSRYNLRQPAEEVTLPY